MKKKIEIVDVIEPKNIIIGDKAAPVTVTEFGDYESEACARANEVVKQLLEAYPGKVNFVFRHYPMLKIHQKAHKAAEAAIGAGQEGKFWEMHNVLFTRRYNLGVTSLKTHAREAGVINKKFLDELLNGTYGPYVQDDLKEGIKLGVTAIPAFFINGKPFAQEPSFKHLNAYIQELLKKGNKDVKTDSKAAA